MFSIVVPTYHRNDLLEQCLERLAFGFQTFTDKYEVIVGDDGVTSDAKSLIESKFEWAQWVPGPKRGPAANRNHAARKAKYDWIAFIDDDCLPDAHWIEALYGGISEFPHEQVFIGKTYASRPRRSFAEFAPINEAGDKTQSCNFLIARTLFDAIGGFDERFSFAFEDVDFFYRLATSDYQLKFLPHASVCHPWRGLPKGKLWRNHARDHHGMMTYISKYPVLIKDLNTLHFVKVFCVRLIQMPREIKDYHGLGFICEVNERIGDLTMALKLLPMTLKYWLSDSR